MPDSDLVSSLVSTRPPLLLPYEIEFDRKFRRPVLFVGLAPNHFGELLTCALGRLWAVEKTSPQTVLYFFARNKDRNVKKLAEILKVFGIDREVYVADGHVRSRKFYTATDLYGERFGGLAAPEYVNWVKRKLSCYTEPTLKGYKIYVTRSHIGSQNGRFACEAELEENLAQNGYEILAAEEYSFEEQLRIFSRAETLIFAEGPAQFVHAFVKKPDQWVINLARQRKQSEVLLNQPIAFEPTPVHWVRAISASYRTASRKNSSSVSLLDFEQLRDELVRLGAIARDGYWYNPSVYEIRMSLYSGLQDGEVLTLQANKGEGQVKKVWILGEHPTL